MTGAHPPPSGRAPEEPKPATAAKQPAGAPGADRAGRPGRDAEAPSILARLDDPKLRARIAMVVGALSIPVAILVTGAMTVRAAGGPGIEGITISSTSTTVSPDSTAPDPLPSGDYEPLCAQLGPNVPAFAATADLGSMSQALLALDLPALIAVAPAELRPTLTTLQSTREQAAQTLASTDGGPITQAQREALPPDFLPSLVKLSLVADERCR